MGDFTDEMLQKLCHILLGEVPFYSTHTRYSAFPSLMVVPEPLFQFFHAGHEFGEGGVWAVNHSCAH